MKKDILVFLSDQHSGSCTGYAGDSIVRTPNLDRIAEKGTAFKNAYTSCPLCVPARMSMLSGQLPSKTGVYSNVGSLPSDQATFLHSLGAEGYETVLCGRMHFDGIDQRHGFTKRIFGDITPLYTGDDSPFKERKEFGPTLRDNGCLDIIGGGNSPTLEYDRHVIKAALDYLQEKHEKPQCIVVGTYAPHYPYVAPPELYDYYLDKVNFPETLSKGCNYDHPAYAGKLRDTSEATVMKARAAYWGMVEFMDKNIGLIYAAWNKYLEENEREGVFIYLSDHGDQAGEHGFYGKSTFYEPSVHIPMVFQGSGIKEGQSINEPNSIMDLGPTLCNIAGAEYPPEQDGRSLLPQLMQGIEGSDRAVISELVQQVPGRGRVPGRMVRQGSLKYITYAGFEADDLLFNLYKDPFELENLSSAYPEKMLELRNIALKDWKVDDILRVQEIRAQHLKLIMKSNKNADLDQRERWHTTPDCIELPENFYKSNAEAPKMNLL